MLGQLLNLVYHEILKPISRKYLEYGKRNFSWKKGGLGVSMTTVHCEISQKEGLAKPFCLSLGFLELSRLSYLLWKRDIWAICSLKNLKYFLTDGYFLVICLSSPGIKLRNLTFWPATQPLLGAHQVIIPEVKEGT